MLQGVVLPTARGVPDRQGLQGVPRRIYIYIYISIYVYTHAYTYVCMYVYIYIYTHV